MSRKSNALVEQSDQIGNDWLEMGGNVPLHGSKQSRFQVAKVDFVNDNPLIDDEETDDGLRPDKHDSLNSPRDSTHQSSYETKNLKSLRHYTREALPRADHYRNILSVHGHAERPTLDELHNSISAFTDGQAKYYKASKGSSGNTTTQVSTGTKFGWIQGVLVRCLLNIWGVMLFLRLSWIVGESGIGHTILIILLATAVTTLTSLSMAAICTNGEVRGGGAYYMISRSLGPEFGGAIGLIFSVANAVAVAMYVVGFSETMRDLLRTNGVKFMEGDDINPVRIIGSATLLLLLAILFIGMEWESRAQLVYLMILLIAMIDFIVGTFIPPTEEEKAKGFMGFSDELIRTNFGPHYVTESFFGMFSIFFPAATGILAGANISGDLKNPQVAIPKGTLLAIVITTFSYIVFAIFVGSVAKRVAPGINISVASNSTNAVNHNVTSSTYCDVNKCKYGLLNDYGIMESISAFGPLIYAGIFSATLSSALASLVSAPKVFQALCKDKLFPYIHFFAKGYGKGDEPRRGYFLTFVIALGCTLIGDLNAIAPIISNFFLAAYALINFSCFHASLVKSPGFRPAFQYYNMWLSLLAAALCIAVMFIINWWTALLTYAIIFTLYMYIYHSKPDVNWGSSTQAQMYQTALTYVTKLNQVEDHVKNYRPQILVLSGNPSYRPPLIDFCNNITKNISLLICGNVVQHSMTQRLRNSLLKKGNYWLQKRKIKAFYTIIENDSLSAGTASLMQAVGIGKLKPNMLMMGFKCNWQSSSAEELLEYFNVIHSAFGMHMSVGILRLQDGLDFSNIIEVDDVDIDIKQSTNVEFKPQLPYNESSAALPYNDSSAYLDRHCSMGQLSTAGSSKSASPPSTPIMERVPMNRRISNNPEGGTSEVKLSSTQLMKGHHKAIPKEVLSSVNRFQRKQDKGTLDVWWLFDDGGLTLLIPYLLTTRSHWSGCKLRVFSLANRKDELDREQRNMAGLLSKFRIDYSDVIVCPDINKRPQESTKKDFDSLLTKWRETGLNNDFNPTQISDAEILALKDKTNRQLRLREMLLQHSKSANMIVMTLPMPRRGTVSAPMYMAWLEILTKDMPPFLLIRGNQTSVLTFYS